MAKVNVYEPPDGTSSVSIETTTQPDGTERQVVRVPESDSILGMIRDLLVLEDFASQGTLDSIRALLAARDEAGQRGTLETRQRQGLAFVASSGRVSVTAGGFLRTTFTNPLASTRTAFLDRITLFASAGPVYGRVLLNPTLGAPGTSRPSTNARLGSVVTSQLEMRSDALVVPLGGGIDTGIDLAVGPYVSDPLALPPLSVPPNVTVGVNVAFAGPADVVLTAYWYEEA